MRAATTAHPGGPPWGTYSTETGTAAINLSGHIGLAAGGTQLTVAHARWPRDAAAATGGRPLVAYDGDWAGRWATLRACPAAWTPARCGSRTGRDPADVLVAAGAPGVAPGRWG